MDTGRRAALVDSHCHLLDEAFGSDRDAVLARARDAGVAHVVVIGTTLEDSGRAADLAAGRAGLSATAGIHPHEAKHWSDATARELRTVLERPGVVAVGEIGLDYHYEHSSRPAQQAAFREQLAMAAERGSPVVVHAREADHDIATILASARTNVVLHSFSSGPELFEAGIAIGAYFSFSGMITFKSWRALEPLTACPADRLLVETDAPYLAPVPYRGRRNEPAFVGEVVNALARARGETPDAVARYTTDNARRVFGLAAPS